MSHNAFDSNDPRLTAYLLGELSDAERAQLELELAESASGRQMLAELRHVTTTLSAALKQGPLSRVSSVCRQAIANACGDRETPEGKLQNKEGGVQIDEDGALLPLSSAICNLPSPHSANGVSKRARSLWIVGTTSACLLMGMTVLLATRGNGTSQSDAQGLGRSSALGRGRSVSERQLAVGRDSTLNFRQEVLGTDPNSTVTDGWHRRMVVVDESGTRQVQDQPAAEQASDYYLSLQNGANGPAPPIVGNSLGVGRVQVWEHAQPVTGGAKADGTVPQGVANQNGAIGKGLYFGAYDVTPSSPQVQAPMVVPPVAGQAAAPASGPALPHLAVSESGQAAKGRGAETLRESTAQRGGGSAPGAPSEYRVSTADDGITFSPADSGRPLSARGKLPGETNGSRAPITRYVVPQPGSAATPVLEGETLSVPARPEPAGIPSHTLRNTTDYSRPNAAESSVKELKPIEEQTHPADRSKLLVAEKEARRATPAPSSGPQPASPSTYGSLHDGVVKSEAMPNTDLSTLRGRSEGVKQLQEQIKQGQSATPLSTSSGGSLGGLGGFGGGGFARPVQLGDQLSVGIRLWQEGREESESLVRLRLHYDQAHDRYLRRLPTIPGTESYAPIVENEFATPHQQRFSTFGIDVDTASYANVRRFLENGQWPPAAAVRLEELINSFSYNVPAPEGEHPISLIAEAAECPWQPAHQLVRISLKGQEINRHERPATSLVFLIDKSGSMKDQNKLPLVKDSLRLLVEELGQQDRISIVTYANGAEMLLDGATAAERGRIMTAIDSLNADGSTNGEAGLKLAYDTAARNFISEGTNRILVCTDGDFNVGTSDDDTLFKMIGEKRKSNVFLSILGFGTGNIKDSKLEGIANHGNGQYSYIDSLKEARRVLVEQLTGTLYTIAKDVKLQVEFNPAQVAYYRLLGYENRTLAAEDFNNDRVDAGDMGAGHSVTALYEIVPAGMKPQGVPTVDPPRYSPVPAEPRGTTDVHVRRESRPQADQTDNDVRPTANELLFVKLRYKLPTSDESIKLDFPMQKTEEGVAASNDLAWAGCVASFGMLLRESKFKGNANWDELLARTRGAMGPDPSGQRREFIDLVFQARSLYKRSHGESVPQPTPLASTTAREKATCGRKYSQLLDKIEVPSDYVTYGEFHDFGKWSGTAYMGHTGLPEGYWVYVYPHWYIWGRVETE